MSNENSAQPVKGQFEREALDQGFKLAGVDEVGRGCIAGPVYAAAVVLDYEKLFQLDERERRLIRDSKTLSAAQRQKIMPIIEAIAKDFAIGVSSVRAIESKGIVPATFAAMRQALGKLSSKIDLLLIDGHTPLAGYPGRQQTFVKGDSLVYAISAASIIAKEARDAHMREADRLYPGYGFAQHVGYGTKQHIQALADNGICPLHRRNFAPVRKYVSVDC